MMHNEEIQHQWTGGLNGYPRTVGSQKLEGMSSGGQKTGHLHLKSNNTVTDI